MPWKTFLAAHWGAIAAADVFSIPRMLRIYFRNHRPLLSKLAQIANECLEQFLRETLHLADGQIGMVMVIHTFGDYLKNFHPHLHAVVADGLFTPSGSFHVMPSVEIKPLEELFRARLIRLLVKERLLAQEMAEDLMNWRHSGFSVYNGEQITN